MEELCIWILFQKKKRLMKFVGRLADPTNKTSYSFFIRVRRRLQPEPDIIKRGGKEHRVGPYFIRYVVLSHKNKLKHIFAGFSQ